MQIPIAQAKRDFSNIVRQAQEQPVVVTRRGRPDVVLLSFEEYESLSQLRAYLRMLRMARRLQGSDTTATELQQASREELETARDLDALL